MLSTQGLIRFQRIGEEGLTMKRKGRSLKKTFMVNGRLVTVVTISGLAQILGKSRNTILRYEKTGVFPPAIFMLNGYRYYPEAMARKLVDVVTRLPLNTKPPADMQVEINKIFAEERSKYAKPKEN